MASLQTSDADGLRNRAKQPLRRDSPRSNSTQLASPSSHKGHPSPKSDDASEPRSKVLGRTPDGTGKSR